MPLAEKSPETCIECGGDNVWEFTKAGENVRRLECDDCGAEWSIPE